MSETPEASTAQSATMGIRPLVGQANSLRSVWLFAVAALLGAGLLFVVLENHRKALVEPSINPTADRTGEMIAPPPDLSIPPQDAPASSQPPLAPALPPAPLASAPPAPPPPPESIAAPRFAPFDGDRRLVPPPPPDAAPIALQRPGLTGAGLSDSGKSADRVMATRFANPATTIPKGTVIQAELETALDSTRAGLARAIVSRDVFGFDGTRILVPKGSRLIGEYKADLAAGQSRALIQWQRLMRPDGVLVNLDSPSADPLGRAGVEGKVDTHFLERFSGAMLQSTVQVGTQVAINRLSDGSGTTIYAMPTPIQGGGLTGPATVQPTLTVRQGTSVSVFVAKDLDFSSVE